MGHRHFCDVAGHWWECEGKALRGDAEPSTCICLPCGRPLEGFDHSGCADPVELLACPEHLEEERRSIEEARKEHEQRAAECASGEADATLTKPAESEAPPEMALPVADQPARPFERFPLVPIEPGDPLWHCDWCCHCGCRRMPRELSGGFCFHCGHVYQRHDPEYWLGEESPHSEAAHLKNCANYQENCKKSEGG